MSEHDDEVRHGEGDTVVEAARAAATPLSQVRVGHTHHEGGPEGDGGTASINPLGTGRRKFLTWFSGAGGGVIGAMLGVPVVGFLLGPLIKKAPQQWRDVGQVGDFPAGQTKVVTFENTASLAWDGQTSKTAAYLRRQGDNSFTALAIYCTHLGCPVNWQPDAELFLCPCHGGVYYADGSVAAGPPPHNLYHYETRVVDGKVQILTGPIPTA
jgi:menaquinol-cytochrome c reductase iron-sulfur subunit